MYTESYILPIPKPKNTPDYIIKRGKKWLRHLADPTTEIDIGLATSHPLNRQWITQKRTRENRYETNYLFFSPDAVVTVQTMHGVIDTSPGTIMWFPPGVPYSLYIKGEPSADNKLYRFRFKALDNRVITTPWDKEKLFPGSFWYPDFVEELAQEIYIPDEYSKENINQLMLRFCIRLFRMEREKEQTDLPLHPAQMRELHTYMIRNVSRRPLPSQLAEVVGLTPAYFTKVFVKNTGMSPRRWILEQRIRYSTQLLQEASMNISEIAYWLGYDKPRLYTRQFSSVFGVSPTAYRKMK